MTGTVERCCLPALTRFTGWHCTGSGPRYDPPPPGSQCTSPRSSQSSTTIRHLVSPLRKIARSPIRKICHSVAVPSVIIPNRGPAPPVYCQCERCRAHRVGPERRSRGFRRPRRTLPAHRLPGGAGRVALARGRRRGDAGRHGLRVLETGQLSRRLQLQDLAAHHHLEPRDGSQAAGRHLVPTVRHPRPRGGLRPAVRPAIARDGARRGGNPAGGAAPARNASGQVPRKRCCCRRPAITRSRRSDGCWASRRAPQNGGRWKAGASSRRNW